MYRVKSLFVLTNIAVPKINENGDDLSKVASFYSARMKFLLELIS